MAKYHQVGLCKTFYCCKSCFDLIEILETTVCQDQQRLRLSITPWHANSVSVCPWIRTVFWGLSSEWSQCNFHLFNRGSTKTEILARSWLTVLGAPEKEQDNPGVTTNESDWIQLFHKIPHFRFLKCVFKESGDHHSFTRSWLWNHSCLQVTKGYEPASCMMITSVIIKASQILNPECITFDKGKRWHLLPCSPFNLPFREKLMWDISFKKSLTFVEILY